jgi:hypothetical protein
MFGFLGIERTDDQIELTQKGTHPKGTQDNWNDQG